jgi:hypothetical protein
MMPAARCRMFCWAGLCMVDQDHIEVPALCSGEANIAGKAEAAQMAWDLCQRVLIDALVAFGSSFRPVFATVVRTEA